MPFSTDAERITSYRLVTALRNYGTRVASTSIRLLKT
jgi:hypothetical protein